MHVSSSLSSPSRSATLSRSRASLFLSLSNRRARAARAWRFTLNVGPLPPVPQRRARVAEGRAPGHEQRRRESRRKSVRGRREEQRSEREKSHSLCLCSRLTFSVLYRSHATDRGENCPKIRGYETRRANTREQRATKKISSIPGIRLQPPCCTLTRIARSRCVFLVDARVLVPQHTFTGYLGNCSSFVSR